jgi:hypothetical protein
MYLAPRSQLSPLKMVSSPKDGFITQRWFHHPKMVSSPKDGFITQRWFHHPKMVSSPKLARLGSHSLSSE